MKKIIKLIFPLIAFSLFAQAQLSYDSSMKDFINMPNDGSIHKTKLFVINNSSDSLEFEWRVLDYFIPQNWSSYGFCDWGGCHPLSYTGWHTPPPIPANSSDSIYASVARSTTGIEGCAIIRIEYRQKGMSSQFLELKHSSFSDANTCWPLSLSSRHKINQVEIYPNPALNQLKIKFDNEAVDKIEIFNMCGQLVKTKSISEKISHLNLSSFSAGMYAIKFSNQDGFIIGQATFIKQ